MDRGSSGQYGTYASGIFPNKSAQRDEDIIFMTDQEESYTFENAKQRLLQILQTKRIGFNKNNVLDIVQQEEMQFSNIIKNDDNSFENTQFPLSSYQPEYSKQFLEIVQFVYPPNLNKPMFQDHADRMGRIRCLTVSQNFLAVAGSLGNIMVIDRNSSMCDFYNMGGSNGAITTLSISSDDSLMAVGSERGCVSCFDLKQHVLLKNFDQIHKCRIVALQFFHNDPKQGLDKAVLLTCDQQGNCLMLIVKKTLFYFGCDTQIILPKQYYPIQNIEILENDLQQRYFPGCNSTTQIVAFSNFQKVWILKLNNLTEDRGQMLFSFENPDGDGLVNSFFASLSWGEGIIKLNEEVETKPTNSLLLVFSWNKTVFLVTGLWSDDESSGGGMSETSNTGTKSGGSNTGGEGDDGSGTNTRFSVLKFGGKQLKFKTSSNLDLKCDLVYSVFISSSVLMFVDIQNEVTVLNTSDLQVFEKSGNKIENIKKLNFKIDKNIMSQAFVLTGSKKDVSQKRLKELKDNNDNDMVNAASFKHFLLFSNSFGFSRNENMIYFLCQDSIGVGILTKWETLLERMIQSGEWMLAMHYLIQIYTGKNKFTTNMSVEKAVRAEQLEEYIKMVASKYIQITLKGVKSNLNEKEINRSMLLIVIEFLLATDHEDMLFDHIQEIIKIYIDDTLKIFIQCLEPFIRKNQIRVISDSALQDVIKHYQEQKKMNLIQRLIISLDIQRIDTSPLFSLCLQHGLFNALIYICSQGNDDEFMAPLSKLWALYISHQYSGDSSQMKEADYFALRALWYVRLCLRGILISGFVMKYQKFQNIVSQISQWIFSSKTTLTDLLKFNPQATFDVLFYFFNGFPESIIEGSQVISIFKSSNPEVKFPVWVVNSGQKIEKIFAFINEKYDQTIAELKNEEQKKKLFNEYVLFQAKLINLQPMDGTTDGGFVKISPQQVKNIIIHILKTPETLNSLDLEPYQGRSIKGIKKEMENSDEFRDHIKSKFLKKILKKHLMLWDLGTLTTVKQEAHLSKFSLVELMLIDQENDDRQTFDAYINTNNLIAKQKIYQWLFQKMIHMQQMKRDTELEAIQEFIIKRLTDLIKLNTEETRVLVSRFHQNAEQTIIMQISTYPNLQLQYIQNILQEREKGVQIDNDIMKLHIELLCKLSPHQVLGVVTKYMDYPLDQCLALCKQYQVRDAQAYLLERAGAIQAALYIHIEIFEDLLKEFSIFLRDNNIPMQNSKVTVTTQKGIDANLIQLDAKIDQIIDVCTKQNQVENSQEIWFRFFEKILDIGRMRIEKKEQSQRPLALFINETIGQIIYAIASHIPIEMLTMKLKTKYSHLDMSELQNTFDSMIQNYNYNMTILECVQTMTQDLFTEKKSQFIFHTTRGIYAAPVCEDCQELLTNQEKINGIIIFSCGHVFHSTCQYLMGNLGICNKCAENQDNIFSTLIQNHRLQIDQLTSTGTGADLKSLNSMVTQNFEDRGQSMLQESKEESQKQQALKGNEPQQNPADIQQQMIQKQKEEKLKMFDRKRNDLIKSIEQFSQEYQNYQ